MKKIIAAVLAMVLIAGLVACTTEEAGQAASGDAGNKLTVWCWDPAFNLFAMEKAAKVYQQANPDFELEIVEVPWDDLQTRLTTAVMAGQLNTLPDIFLMQNNAFQKNLINFPEIFTDLTGSKINLNEFAPAVVAYSTVDGRNFGVPFDNGAAIAAYRLDILEEAGYTLEDFTDITWATYLEQAEDILEKTGIALLSGVAGETDTVMMMLQSVSASLFDANGNPDIAENDILKQCVEMYTELVNKRVYIEVNSWDEYIGTINSGATAGVINGCWILGSIQAADDQHGLWGITNLPSVQGIRTATNYSANGGSSWAVSSNTQNAELAIDFLASTFGGSIEFYENILFAAGALANWLPAGESDVYNEPQPFFRDEPIFALITEFAGHVPSNYTGVFYYEARDAVGTALTQVLGGMDMDTALREAEDVVLFAMGR